MRFFLEHSALVLKILRGRAVGSSSGSLPEGRWFESSPPQQILERWQTWCMRRTENPAKMIRFHLFPHQLLIEKTYGQQFQTGKRKYRIGN